MKLLSQPYKPKTLKGAAKKIRQLQREIDCLTSRVFVEANKGGTFVEIQNIGKDEFCYIRVGKYCVVTVDGEFSVERLADAINKEFDPSTNSVENDE